MGKRRTRLPEEVFESESGQPLQVRAKIPILVSEEMARIRREKGTCCLIMMDIDHFKKVNDTFGHSGGDAVLRQVGAMLQKYFRTTDIAGRLGGEEFGVFLPHTSLSGAYRAAENFRQKLAREPIVYEDRLISITVSTGICADSPAVEDIAALLKQADRALYQSKANGRNRTTIC